MSRSRVRIALSAGLVVVCALSFEEGHRGGSRGENVRSLTLVAAIGSAAPVASTAPEVAWALAAPPLEWVRIEATPPAERPNAERGAALFARLCVACHGERARGDGVLAAELPRRPRDLVAAKIRTRDRLGVVSAAELFRTISAGAPFYGMPSFAAVPEADRWALVAFVTQLRGGRVEWTGTAARELPPMPPGGPDIELGRRQFRRRGCFLCHGDRGDGDGAMGIDLRDERGDKVTPAPFARGPEAFRAGPSLEAIARTILGGRPGTPMVEPSSPISPEELWGIAALVRRFAEEGLAARRARWDAFFGARRDAASIAAMPGSRVAPDEERFDAAVSARAAHSPPGERGCSSCHTGVAEIASGRMAQAIAAFAGGDRDRGCTICHEGDALADEKTAAHAGLLPNPGSLWVTSVGGGCGKCHSDRGALTTLEARPFPEPVGGRLLAVVSKKTDPTGASGSNHAYRIQRALMAQETGKVYLGTASAGIVAKGAPRFTDFAVDDPDGPVPTAGSALYRAFIARAIEAGVVKRFARGEPLPTFEEARALANGDGAAAGYVDSFRKDCARCHLWGEGAHNPGERRSSGCAACHVLNDEAHVTYGNDPTIPIDRPGHAMKHEIVMAPPETQCNHCHTRGFWTQHSDTHQRAGLECGDCHTSIDVHGDGNLYPQIRHQLEIHCEDCHGSPTKAPWELPVGAGTKAEDAGPRGVVVRDGKEHLLTARGNVRANWTREGDAVFVESFATGRRWRARLLKDGAASTAEITTGVAAHGVANHAALNCSACHGGTGPRCGVCHMSYSRLEVDALDPILAARNYDPKTTRSRMTFTRGKTFTREPASMPQGDPEMRPDERGRQAPHIRGCRVLYSYYDDEGKPGEFAPRMNPGRSDYPPPVAPSLSHENSLKARECTACHAEGTSGPVTFPGQEGR